MQKKPSFKIVEENGIMLIKRCCSPWVVGKLNFFSEEEYGEWEASSLHDSHYATITGTRIVIEALDSDDVFVKKLKPDTLQKYLQEMLDWYFDTILMKEYRRHCKYFKNWYYYLIYNRYVRVFTVLTAVLAVLILLGLLVSKLMSTIVGTLVFLLCVVAFWKRV